MTGQFSLSIGIRSARYLLVLAFVVWPVYLFPAGYPQLLSAALVAAFGLLIACHPTVWQSVIRSEILALMCALFVYSVLVNVGAALVDGRAGPLIYSAYYLQALLACLVMHYLLETAALTSRYIFWAILASLLLQVIMAVWIGIDVTTRATVLFGNPNQLGLYGLLALSFLMLVRHRCNVSAIAFYSGAALSLAAVLLSLSKAAIVSAMAACILYALLIPARRRSARILRPLVVVLGAAAMIAFVAHFQDRLTILASIMDRLAAIGQSGDDSLVGRGYGRIIEWPQYLLFGAGEGLYDRWRSRFEIHSMLGTLAFCYGIIGTVALIWILAIVARRNPRDFAICIGPVLLYSLTHNPMRQPMLWMLLVLVVHLSPPRARPAGTPHAGRRKADGLAIPDLAVYMPRL